MNHQKYSKKLFSLNKILSIKSGLKNHSFIKIIKRWNFQTILFILILHKIETKDVL
jgi:hypothetical protein